MLTVHDMVSEIEMQKWKEESKINDSISMKVIDDVRPTVDVCQWRSCHLWVWVYVLCISVRQPGSDRATTKAHNKYEMNSQSHQKHAINQK